MMKQIGRYNIIRELGRGGMAVVYLAADPKMEDRQVAVKVLPASALHDPGLRERFKREASTIIKLSHRSIVDIYDYSDDLDLPFIVMPYMRGGSLADRLRKGPLLLAEAASIVNQLADALDAAHQRGVIHRDLKPGNILFDEHGYPYLSDFGIVKLTQPHVATLTVSKNLVGTVAYMSPEQIRKKEIDGRSDIYALGIIVYEMLTGVVPCEGDDIFSLLSWHIIETPPNVTDRNSNLPPAVNDIVHRALAKDPEDRYSTARQLSRALSNAAGMAGDFIKSTAVEIPLVPPTAQIDSSLPEIVRTLATGEPLVEDESSEATGTVVVSGREDSADNARDAASEDKNSEWVDVSTPSSQHSDLDLAEFADDESDDNPSSIFDTLPPMAKEFEYDLWGETAQTPGGYSDPSRLTEIDLFASPEDEFDAADDEDAYEDEFEEDLSWSISPNEESVSRPQSEEIYFDVDPPFIYEDDDFQTPDGSLEDPQDEAAIVGGVTTGPRTSSQPMQDAQSSGRLEPALSTAADPVSESIFITHGPPTDSIELPEPDNRSNRFIWLGGGLVALLVIGWVMIFVLGRDEDPTVSPTTFPVAQVSLTAPLLTETAQAESLIITTETDVLIEPTTPAVATAIPVIPTTPPASPTLEPEDDDTSMPGEDIRVTVTALGTTFVIETVAPTEAATSTPVTPTNEPPTATAVPVPTATRTSSPVASPQPTARPTTRPTTRPTSTSVPTRTPNWSATSTAEAPRATATTRIWPTATATTPIWPTATPAPTGGETTSIQLKSNRLVNPGRWSQGSSITFDWSYAGDPSPSDFRIWLVNTGQYVPNVVPYRSTGISYQVRVSTYEFGGVGGYEYQIHYVLNGQLVARSPNGGFFIVE